ncbi:MAG TPA: NAD-dependent epimerase/dehydratase family protein [Candidatus Dormibacteraeota bacterium]|nr:NAD-dependent epimerase/dehydratase family protein [Candidatus Dormibacteraeota bacterium]
MRIAVTGGTGFVGTEVVRTLLLAGHELRVVGRGVRQAPLPDGPRLTFGDVVTGAGLDAAFADADAVIHLTAVIRERGPQTFAAVNAQGTATAVAAAERAGVRRFVHLSALGVDPDPAFPYLASKWQGEQAVRGSGLDWVIVRSSVIFGPGDGFFRQLAGALRVPSPFLVIPGDGQALFQPIAVGDVARCLRAAVEEPARRHQVYEIGGPEHLTLEQIMRAVAAATGRDWFLFSPRRPLRVPVAALMPVGALMDRLLPNPPVTAQQLALLARVNATRLDAVPAAFGFDPEPLATHLQSLRPRRRWASPPSRPV